MKNLITKSVTLAILLLTFNLQAQCAMLSHLSATHYAEAALGGARGILASASHRHKDCHTPAAKAIHAVTDLTRLMHEILTIVNHSKGASKETNYAVTFWAAFDASNLFIDLLAKNKQNTYSPNLNGNHANYDEMIDLSQEQKQLVGNLAKSLQNYLLPLVESGTCIYNALNVKPAPQDRLMRRRVQALCSLSRALSIYINHQSSKPAILLLIAAISELGLSLHAKPPLPPRIQLVPPPGQQLRPQSQPQPQPQPQPGNHQTGYRAAIEQFRHDDQVNRAAFAISAQVQPVVRLEGNQLIVERGGVRVELGEEDAITQMEWEAGDLVKVFACNHATLIDNIRPMEEAETERQQRVDDDENGQVRMGIFHDLGYVRHLCHLCQRIRVPALERDIEIPNP